MSDLLDALDWQPEAEHARLKAIAYRCDMIGMHEGLYAGRLAYEHFQRLAVELRRWADADSYSNREPHRIAQLLDDLEHFIEAHWVNCTRRTACFMRHHTWPSDRAPLVRSVEE